MKKHVIGMVSLALALGMPAVAQAETVIEKVARTGVLTVGTRFDLVPYSYIDTEGNLVGYSVDIVSRIEVQLEAELSPDIVVQRREAQGLTERIPLITSGEIDLACDTQFTWERDRHVDFSVSYGLSGIRLLTREGSDLATPESLVGQRIGLLGGLVAQKGGTDVYELAPAQPYQRYGIACMVPQNNSTFLNTPGSLIFE